LSRKQNKTSPPGERDLFPGVWPAGECFLFARAMLPGLKQSCRRCGMPCVNKVCTRVSGRQCSPDQHRAGLLVTILFHPLHQVTPHDEGDAGEREVKEIFF